MLRFVLIATPSASREIIACHLKPVTKPEKDWRCDKLA